LGSMALGLVGVVRRDRADPRVRCPEQVTHDIGLPILGVLPHVKVRGAWPEDEHVAQVIEAMRSVRLSLSQTHGGSGPMLVTVSSPGIADGKSFVSADLAVAYSGAGQRSLLLVLRTGATSLELARTKLRVLDRLPIRLLGVVVNDVRPRGVYRYHSYLSGYGTADEAEYAMGPPRVRGVL